MVSSELVGNCVWLFLLHHMTSVLLHMWRWLLLLMLILSFLLLRGCFVPFFFFFLLLLDDGRRICVTDLALNTDKVGNISSSIAKSGNEKLIPKGGSIDSVIQQTHTEIVALFDSVSDAFHGLRVRFGPLQKPTVATEDLIQ